MKSINVKKTTSALAAILSLAISAAIAISYTQQNAIAIDKYAMAANIINAISEIAGIPIDAEIASDYYTTLFRRDSEEKPVALESSDFVFIFTDDGANVETIHTKSDASLLGYIASDSDAMRKAELLAFSACPSLFVLSEYDSFCEKHIANGDGCAAYTIEFWEKIAESHYTGNKISMIVTSEGCVSLFLSSSSNSAIAIENIKNGQIENTGSLIPKEKAIEIAYTAIEAKAMELENPTGVSEPTNKPGGGFIAEPEDAANNAQYKIFTQNREEHVVEAYSRLLDGSLKWDITVKMQTTFPWWKEIAFWVVIDGHSGVIELLSHTR
ncbi:MAG: hypothetical protein FWG30_05010 [Eubacteriaceae bacterium]|nr:hypothetical protein [Eubacteriaceae bacterium]